MYVFNVNLRKKHLNISLVNGEMPSDQWHSRLHSSPLRVEQGDDETTSEWVAWWVSEWVSEFKWVSEWVWGLTFEGTNKLMIEEVLLLSKSIKKQIQIFCRYHWASQAKCKMTAR